LNVRIRVADHQNTVARARRFILLAALMVLGACAAPEPQPRTVAAVDLPRYLGTWHEVARYPNWFQDSNGQHCVDVTATYTARPDGTVGVRNACGDGQVANGWARVVDPENTKLRVTFFWPFFGDYWVIGLDPAYRWAVVGTPNRNYLWVLSRSPTLSQQEYDTAIATAAAQGFDLAKLVKTAPQT
jgi:apolipoprotein D and lipocalin family protein